MKISKVVELSAGGLGVYDAWYVIEILISIMWCMSVCKE